jgi:crotonobetainyl-CoA:carnitine CoA-transferase CaiB-like acyl-CoA transferase
MQILDGIRVIDLTMWAFMPSAGGVLAHWGADVIKVENPGACDPARLLYGGTDAPGEASRSFKHYNRGKRAVGIDLATEDGRAILYRSAEESW